MLNLLSIKNFRSIIDLSLPLTYGEAKAPNGYQAWTTLPFLEQKSVRAVPCLGLFGANASGKSTVIQAMAVLKRLINGHSANLFMPNKLHKDTAVTTFTVQGVLPKAEPFEYAIGYDATEILSEKLVCNGKVVYRQDGGNLTLDGLQKKYYGKERLLDIYKVECLNKDGRHAGSILSRIALNYAGLNSAVSSVCQALTDNLDVFENNTFSSKDGLNMLMVSLGTKADKQSAFTEIDTLLRKFDLGILRMEFHPENAGDANSLADTIRTFHHDDTGKEVQFRFEDESMGTRAAFGLIGVCLAVLHSGKVLVIDEIDSSLHSLLVAEIIKLFKDKRYNTSNAQLIFSAHNTDLLDRELLRVSEVGIVNKNLKHGSVLKRLSDFDGVRNVTNFRKQYLEGRFSGIPFPYL